MMADFSIQKYFPYDKKKVADEMVEKIREEFKIMLEELDWMDPQVNRNGREDQEGVQDHARGVGLDGFSGK